jgi:hypothetical protein
VATVVPAIDALEHPMRMEVPIMTTLLRRPIYAAFLALFAVTLLASTASAAKGGNKPPSEPPPEPPALDGGAIYYREWGADLLHAVAPDGTGDQTLPAIPGGYTRPSKVLHAGDRWYLALRPSTSYWSPGFFPGGGDGGRRYELDLIRESDAANPIALTDNGGACIQMWSDSKMFDWAVDASGVVDGAVSWLGTRWADDDGDGSCDRVLDGGVFRSQLVIAADGAVKFTQPTGPEIPIALDGNEVSAEDFDWSPDGAHVSYTTWLAGQLPGLWVADAGGSTRIYTDYARLPAWSPDLDAGQAGAQSRIAFHSGIGGADGNYATYTIAPDGSSLVEITRGQTARGRKPAVYHWLAQWSPAGTHLAYLVSSSGEPWKVRIVSADGAVDTPLVDQAGWLNGWSSDG